MSACLDQAVHGLVGDINGFFNNKTEMLRSLFVTKKQFVNLIERDCDGNLSGPIQGHVYTEHELDFMDSFLKTFELGLDQLDDFMWKLDGVMGMLDSISGVLRLDESSILYYLRQVLNGPWACAAVDISSLLSGNFNILQSTNNAIGTLGNAVRNNISATVYGLEPVNAALDLYNHLPPKMQENIGNGIKTATNVFNFNQESQVYNDNTTPYIDKLPGLRVNTEWLTGFTNVASGNLMLKDISFFNTLTKSASAVFSEIENALGVAANKIYRFQKLTNIFASDANKAFGALNAVNRLLISLNTTESTTTTKIVQKKCEQIRTNIFGTTITDDSTFNQQMITSDGAYDLYTLDGQGGLRTDPRTQKPTGTLTGIDMYETCEEATNRGSELGCEGCHKHTTSDGQVFFMPCNTMDEYEDIISGKKEPDCDVDKECDNLKF